MDVIIGEVIGAGEEARRELSVGSWGLTVWVSKEEEPTIRDLDLAERLGYSRPRKIRELIEKLIERGQLTSVKWRPTVGRQTVGRGRGGEREYEANEYHLTEGQALKVIARSETEVADAILDEMIRVFMLARRGLFPGRAELEARVAKLERALAIQPPPGVFYRPVLVPLKDFARLRKFPLWMLEVWCTKGLITEAILGFDGWYLHAHDFDEYMQGRKRLPAGSADEYMQKLDAAWGEANPQLPGKSNVKKLPNLSLAKALAPKKPKK